MKLFKQTLANGTVLVLAECAVPSARTGFPGSTIEEIPVDEIKECYQRMGVEMATRSPFSSTLWDANSQYGHCLKDGFIHKEAAEQHSLLYYADRMNLIRQ